MVQLFEFSNLGPAQFFFMANLKTLSETVRFSKSSRFSDFLNFQIFSDFSNFQIFLDFSKFLIFKIFRLFLHFRFSEILDVQIFQIF